MPNLVYAVTSDHSFRYLDVAPMITALRFQPSDFEYARDRLRHVPSWQGFQFDKKGGVAIDAPCGCAALSVKFEQADELHSAFTSWKKKLLATPGDKPGVRVTLR